MVHLALILCPHDDHLTPYRVTFRRPASGPLPSMREDGVRYCHPERHEEAIVWTTEPAEIAGVLAYHYGHDWSDLHVATEA